MTMNVSVASARIAREIHEAEAALEEALIKQSLLFSSMVTARRDLATGKLTGQEALLRLTKSQQALLAAGSELGRVHNRMRDVHHEITGDLASDCPPQLKPVGHHDESLAA
ncbi:hypothetical protein [Novosphingobium album (ex Liu et al. 2023)]|uniref:Uncharacterized protein n=1 Tax=Novosphingobium album (ex Liu et al. 2023) TaxID=3031130 RepID=A0ABT5WMU3_9SPHN|nr:hypothetical protein [Novosphingobium album (ex Liu et al. 2023)]MDE8651350.1 hypothetical protein [Novosphingobium album (ex Liu et al. 2023)]